MTEKLIDIEAEIFLGRISIIFTLSAGLGVGVEESDR